LTETYKKQPSLSLQGLVAAHGLEEATRPQKPATYRKKSSQITGTEAPGLAYNK
jgi:hypothetical protein